MFLVIWIDKNINSPENKGYIRIQGSFKILKSFALFKDVEEAIIYIKHIKFDDTNYLSTDLLMPYVLNTLNIKLTPYYSYLINESKNILPAYNKYIIVNNEGKLFYPKDLDNDMLKEYNLRKNLQYKIYFSD